MSDYTALYLKFSSKSAAKTVLTMLMVDGVGEFLPSGPQYAINPDATSVSGDSSYYVMLSCPPALAATIPDAYKVTRPSSFPEWLGIND